MKEYRKTEEREREDSDPVYIEVDKVVNESDALIDKTSISAENVSNQDVDFACLS